MEKKTVLFYLIFDVLILGSIVCLLLKLIPLAIVLLILSVIPVFIGSSMQESCRRMLEKEKLILLNEKDQFEEECQKRSNKIKEQSKEQIAKLHGQISHGLRIPLSVIYGYAELLSGDLITDEIVRKEYLNKICDRINYIDELFSRIIMDSRMDANLSEFVFQEIDILGLVKRISKDMSLAAQKIGVKINVISEEDNVHIFGDQTQLTKAFYNIIENALKYMNKRGKIDITVSKTKKEQVCITFMDDGNGLSKEETNHIFDSGFQGANRCGGSGMGLNIVQMVVSAHGGETFARSVEGRGMDIFLFLPIRPKL